MPIFEFTRKLAEFNKFYNAHVLWYLTMYSVLLFYDIPLMPRHNG